MITRVSVPFLFLLQTSAESSRAERLSDSLMSLFAEEVILSEEKTSTEDKIKIMEGDF